MLQFLAFLCNFARQALDDKRKLFTEEDGNKGKLFSKIFPFYRIPLLRMLPFCLDLEEGRHRDISSDSRSLPESPSHQSKNLKKENTNVKKHPQQRNLIERKSLNWRNTTTLQPTLSFEKNIL